MKPSNHDLSDKCLTFIQMALEIHDHHPSVPMERILKVGLDAFIQDLDQEERFTLDRSRDWECPF